MARIDPTDLDDDDGIGDVDVSHPGRGQDGVDALRDTEAEAGDDSEIRDAFDMDHREARELGVNLDDRDEPEPGFS
ncbi:MAG: hypothetical protein QOD07_968 [Frankiaceae bacterium]|jgi:hypothetical protein|nr:hypothetical protein [Frankiaceae bacterium]